MKKSGKYSVKILTLLVLSAYTVVNGYCQQEYDIFLMIGQSNMAGRGKLTEEDFKVIEGVYLLNAENSPEPATNPLNKYSTIRKDLSMQQMSPAYGFAVKLHRETGRKILLIVNARGGSTIEEWSKDNPDKNYYSEAVKRTKEGCKYGVLKAIIWHQGEGNSEDPTDYLSKLSLFVSNLREDFGDNQLPFIAGEIARWWEPYASKFNPVIQSISTVIPCTDYITVEGTKSETDLKDPHFNRESQIIIGERYARKALLMCYGIKEREE